MTVLKPLHGDEPLLEAGAGDAVRSRIIRGFQIVFGVQDAADPALAVVRRAAGALSRRDIAAGRRSHAARRQPQIGNLINMLPAARHDVLVIADCDVHARAGLSRRAWPRRWPARASGW